MPKKFRTQCTGDGKCKKDARYKSPTGNGAPLCFKHYHMAKAEMQKRKHVEVGIPGNIVRKEKPKSAGKALAAAVAGAAPAPDKGNGK